jgi:hypothetical protein
MLRGVLVVVSVFAGGVAAKADVGAGAAAPKGNSQDPPPAVLSQIGRLYDLQNYDVPGAVFTGSLQ